ncbi:hypothetical protein NQ318_023497 [Aromia moschata]|uniref:DDE-1 domain-containing protein n=1 Tax=Aromia moschata TaxID=1265417 RepID=A0AAV8YNM8_9CUCU|nr:hypothetical protein NQ318_023497 [Aromia moschata]
MYGIIVQWHRRTGYRDSLKGIQNQFAHQKLQASPEQLHLTDTMLVCFFDNLSSVDDRYQFNISDVYNVDETGLTTVQKQSKIVAKKRNQASRGNNFGRTGTTISTAGNSVPPMLIFPRKKFQQFMIANAPPGCIEVASPCGWITDELFLQFIKQFAAFTRCTADKPVLLLLDNNESHLSIAVLNYCKANGIVL